MRDLHSDGTGAAFLSAADDTDEAYPTRISLVFGRMDDPFGWMVAARLYAGGISVPPAVRPEEPLIQT
ncbi:hypothetical protein [Novosphingobium sp. AP12]|uniref:hypothetical protein n=1 Tax=Novosphingobium sp. AP12 TaxID=1144305 RepID=UPI000271D8BB|nr:hypothetical protein [Novosphingobium sp. AP12]EJL29501.1 hypothetical protein PMI02_02215 [Novosphingobium sp. AP12]